MLGTLSGSGHSGPTMGKAVTRWGPWWILGHLATGERVLQLVRAEEGKW